ncbi:glycosyltransferase family 4 protein [uncultured Litoreibacter sp.]|uniref:glycosyltransferase family 4 protein n=1 Tax=uncultured Litoreibacter sp. TaxID=1392394 RepID=UPI00262EE5D0|nr:glycosyltransferase family 4 protein [uncultured Litoreibacter sp.]
MGIFSKKREILNGLKRKDDVGLQAIKVADGSLLERLSQSFDAAYYLTTYGDVLASGNDPFEHFMNHGWREQRRPNSWFDPEEYLARNSALVGTETNPFVHYMMHENSSKVDLHGKLSTLHTNRVMYWAAVHQGSSVDSNTAVVLTAEQPRKKDLKLVRRTFDTAYYKKQNPDLIGKVSDLFLHFMTIGWTELRDPNPDFSVSYYLRNNEDIRRKGINPYLHHLKRGQEEHWRPFASVSEVAALDKFEQNPYMLKMVAEAKALEPMVAQPEGPRVITSPLQAAAKITDVFEVLRQRLAGKTYKYIVAIPHVRLSGASRVAAIFADTLAEVRDPAEILVITTDSSESEYIEWFSEQLDIFDLSKEIADLTEAEKIRALIDVLRGVECKILVNVNSRLTWEAMRTYGRQLHQELRVLTYLFTWEENAKGDRFGYPIEWLRDTFDYHHLLITDTKSLANDIADRLGYEVDTNDAQVVSLYTPIADGEVAVANRRRPNNQSGHFLWAGRFAPQKRLDLLVAIARANPSMTFDVYGKTVLGQEGISSFDPPTNIILKGTYTDLQTVLETPYTGFLYTAQWDGLPTILLDMAAAGLPIVASNVGGIDELLDVSTGWLIDKFEVIESYSAALKEVAADSSVADVRTAALQARLARQFTHTEYVEKVDQLVSKYDV